MPSEGMRDIPPSGVTPAGGRRGSGHLAVLGRPRTQSRDHWTLETGTSFVEDCGGPGRARSQPERFARRGKSAKGEPRSGPDSGDPTVRDRRGARGDMAMGVGQRPTAKAVDEPPNPKVRALRIYPDRRRQSQVRSMALPERRLIRRIAIALAILYPVAVASAAALKAISPLFNTASWP